MKAAEKAQAVAVIANIGKVEWVLHRTHGTYVIPPCPNALPYSVLRIVPRQGQIDLGDNRKMPFDIDPESIAEDLCNEVNSNAGPNSFSGVFVCANEKPTPAELQDAHDKLKLFYEGIVLQADKNYERGGGMILEISDLERRAAKYLGVDSDKEWCHTQPAKQLDCPACGEKLKAGVAVCRICGAVLDKKRAAEFGLGSAPEKKGKQTETALQS